MQEPAQAPSPEVSAKTTRPRTSIGLAATDTRKGLVWRTVAGGALLTWGILFLLVGSSFGVVHLSILVKHGYANAHESVLATAWVSFASTLPALLLLVAGAGWLSGRGSPRALAFAGFVANTLWAGAAIYALAVFYHPDSLVIASMLACGATVLATALCMGLVIAANQWMAGRPKVGKPRSVPYPLWGGPLLIVLGSLTVLRLAYPLLEIPLKLRASSSFWRQARETFTELPMFWGALAALIVSLVVIAAGVGLLRRSRWSVAAGGGAGLAALLILMLVPGVLAMQNRLGEFGGAEALPLVIWVMAAHGIAAWIALGGALRFGFQLPSYLRDASDAAGGGNRSGLMDTLTRSVRTPSG